MPNQRTAREVVSSKTTEEVINEAKRIEESALHSAKGHFEAAAFWNKFHLYYVGIPTVILAAVIAALSHGNDYHIPVGIISLIVAGLTALQTFLDPNRRATSHFDAGNSYDAVQNAVRIFRTIECWQDNSPRALTEKLKEFMAEKDRLNRHCPPIPTWAYRRAKKGIDAGEGSYRVDEEREATASSESRESSAPTPRPISPEGSE